MPVCLVGSWTKIPNGEDGLEMAENIFINRDNIKLIPEDRDYLSDFRLKHPDVKAALVDGIDMFDDQYFGTGESEAICMDPQQRMLMQGVIQALENSGVTIEMASEARVAVYTAAWTYDYKDLLPPDQYMATGNSASVMCGRITYFLNSRGAAVGIETACSSSLVAFHLARQAIMNGETKLALVCGANHIGSRSFHSLYNSHMVSPNGRLAAFDRSANGFVRAESFAVAVLCSTEFAEQNGLNIQCKCIGSAFNSDGKTASLTAPNPISQYEVQLEAMGNKIKSDSVQLVTCHGTGTKLGDQIELTAIKTSFKPDIRVMSPKSSLGHGEGAAGLIGVLQSLYSMNHGIIPNQLHLQLPAESLGENVSMTFVNEECDLKRVAISSYGFGGTNACAIIDQAKEETSTIQHYAESKVLFLSAKSIESLKMKIEEFGFFMTHTDSKLEDILFTENERKTKYDIRAAVFGKSREEIAGKLINGDYVQTNISNNEFTVEFGEGNEKLWLLRMLYESNEKFRAAVDKYCTFAESCGFPEARTALFFPFKLTLTPLTYNVSRLISSMATFELLVDFGTMPSKISGRGLGHIFCLAASKAITFEHAVQLIKTVVAEGDLTECIGNIDLKTAKTAIDIKKRNSAVKKITPLDIIGEINSTALPNLMTFRVNGEELHDVDPITKVQNLLCRLFVSGFDPRLTFRGKIVKTPGYAFLKRRFWPEPTSENPSISEKNCENKIENSLDFSELQDTVKEIVKRFLDIDDEDVNLLETGAVDSLTSIEMIEAIGSAVDQTMPFDLLESYPTTEKIVEYLKTIVPDVSKTPKTSKSTPTNLPTSSTEANVISADFLFADSDGGKELWDTLLTSRLVTKKLSETRKVQCGGDPDMNVGLLKQDISLFDNSFFSIAKDEAEFVDPQHRLLLHSAYNALEKSGLSSIPDADLFLAISSHSEYRTIAEKSVDELDERLWMGTVHSMAAGRLAALMGVRGRAVLVDTTCSSIATALEMAMTSIRNGKKYAIVATSQLIQSSKWLYSLRTLLDHHSTKSFSADGTGFCRSDGVGVIILKAYEQDDPSVLKISNAETTHCGAVFTPVVSTISQLLENVGSISYIEGHGTGTTAGDGAESMAYQKLGQDVVMSSAKAQFGHCEVASGLMQIMKVACLSRVGLIPAIVHNCLPNEHIRNNDKIRLPFVSEECDIEKSAIVSFGITGTKTVVTTEKVEELEVSDSTTIYMIPMSAKTKDALKKTVLSMITMLQETSETLQDISRMMQKQKTSFKWRAAVVGSNHEEMIKKLKKVLENDEKRIVGNWNVATDQYSIGCVSFMENIEGFRKHYITFCQRLRFEPDSDTSSIYHTMAVVYALVKMMIEQKLTNSFAVSGFNSFIVLCAIDAAPSHYLNDLIHAFAKNDPRTMKRIARDVTIQVENVELLDMNGIQITTARQAVEAAIDHNIPSKQFSEKTIILSSTSINKAEPLQTATDYYKFIAEKFIEGSKIDFVSIFGKSTKIVDLPEYPFNRKSFWLPSAANPLNTIQTYDATEKTAETQKEFNLNSDKWKHVRNHVVDSQIVLPGATSIRLAYELSGKQEVTMNNIDFLNKISPKETPVIISQTEKNDYWTLLFDDIDAISFTINNSKEKNSKFIPNERVMAEIKNIDEIYSRFSQSHLTYRNEFQMINWMRCCAGKGEAHFVEVDKLDILIDGTLQSIVMCYFMENFEDQSPFVPFTIDAITILNSDLSKKKMHTILKYDASTNFITGDATVYDDLGNMVLHIQNVTFKRLNGRNSTLPVHSNTVMSSVTKSQVENKQLKMESSMMLHKWFEENFGWSDIDDTTGFFDLGLTSIQAVKLRNAIKSSYPDASSTCVFDFPSIKELSSYLSSLVSPISEDETREENTAKEEEIKPPTRLSMNPIGVMAASCRLPGGITCPSELWELLKIGKNASSRIPATRIPTRNNLISGTKYGNSVEGGNFITQDVTMFDPAFFKISKSEAELIDPQQRILLECVQECFENSGVTEADDVGVFVGLMEKEYQDMMESSSILAMLGSMAAVIAGRINYVFGCHGPSVTIDTACSSSLVALEMAVNSLLDGRCSKVIVAGVNLILNERGQGLRTNGKMLSNHGMSLSFDSRASGYGRSDGCVVLMLELAKPVFHYMSTIQAVNVNHGGRSVSLTAPNGVAHKMLLTSVINQSPSLAIDYWEAHGTGTPLGDPIEFNTLSSILQNILIGSVKASLGHGEASAGTCGLLKLFLMLTNQYVPTLIHFHVLNKDINAGSIRLPIIGEEAELTSAGISSFGVSGTNAAAIAFNDNDKLEPYTSIHKYYVLPISAKNENSLEQLEKEILSMIPVTDVAISNIASALANNRTHYAIRNALIVNHSGKIVSKSKGKPFRIAKKEKYRVKISSNRLEASILQLDLVNEFYTAASMNNPTQFSMKHALFKFLTAYCPYVEVVAENSEDILAILLANGTLSWDKFKLDMLTVPIGSVLNYLTEQNINSSNNATIRNYQDQPESKLIESYKDILDMMVHLYIIGYELDWSSVYPPVEKFVKLPNYQFNRQSLWFEEQKEVVDHYLIGTIDDENETTLVLKNLISELRHPQFYNGKPLGVGTIMEIAVDALKIRNELPFSIQNLTTSLITLTKPSWLKTVIDKNSEDLGFAVKAFIDDQMLFTLTAVSFESEQVELPVVEVSIPEKTIHLKDCPNANIRKQQSLVFVDSRSETSPFQTANLVLNEIIGFVPNPSDMFLEIFGKLSDVYYMIQVDDGALWQFQIISQDKHVLSNIYVLKDGKGLEIPTIRLHKKSTLLSSQEAQAVAQKTMQMDILNKVKCAFNDVIDTGLEIDESQTSTGFTELGMDSLATVDLLNRLNQKYFPEIELTTSDLFDNPNIIDLSICIEGMIKEKGIEYLPSAPQTPKTSFRERKISIPAKKHQEIAQIEFVENYYKPNGNVNKEEEETVINNSQESIVVDRSEIKRKISSAVFDLATDNLNNEDLETKGFTEMGMDSLSIVDFVNRLNDKYFPGEDINASDIFDYPTVDELTDHITKKKSLNTGLAPLVENGVVVEMMKETSSDHSPQVQKMDQSYLLVNVPNSGFNPDVVISFTPTCNLELRDWGTDKKLLTIKKAEQKQEDLAKYLSAKPRILLNFDSLNDNDQVEDLYMVLLTCMKLINKTKIKCRIAVSPVFSLGNSIARAFMKTISSEKYPIIEFVWDQQVQQISFTDTSSAIEGNWLVTGGLSGIGLEIGKFLANNGANTVVLISRRKPTEEMRKDISNWKAKVHTIASDISDEKKLMEELQKINIRITGIIHSAGVLKDSKIERQTQESFKQVFNPKANGFDVLEKIEKHFQYKLDNFIMMSSFTSGCGNEGQLNYGVANAYLEHQVQRRRNEGKSGCAIQWGNWTDTGMATSANVRKFLADLGFLGQRNEEALRYLNMCIKMKPSLIMVANINWETILKNRPDLPRDLVEKDIVPYDDFMTSHENFKQPINGNGIHEPKDISDFEEININIVVEDKEEVLELIKAKISELVKTPSSRIKNNKNIMDVGLNSHLLTVFLDHVNSTFKTDVSLSDAYSHSSLDKLSNLIWKKHLVQKNSKLNAVGDRTYPSDDKMDFCPIFGLNLFFDKLESFDEDRKTFVGFLNSEKSLRKPESPKFALPITGKSMDDVIRKINNSTQQNLKKCQNSSKSVIMLTGQGSQYPMMGRQLCEQFGIFRRTLKKCLTRCDEFLKGEAPLWEILFNTEYYEQLQLTKHMQPIMFCFGYATAKLWLSIGVKPDFYLGHSVGELVAGVLAGIMTIDEGLELIVERGKAMERVAGLGALLAVQREVADEVLRRFSVSVATINSPKQIVFAGTKQELDKALAYVKGQGKQGTFVNQKYPFHSNIIQEHHLADLRKCLKKINFQKGSSRLVSNVSGHIIDTFTEQYIIKHTVSAVKFVNCVETLVSEGVNVWIDAGPAAVLATFVKRIIPPSELSHHRIVQTCKDKEEDADSLVQACLELEQTGTNICWAKLYGCDVENDLSLVEFPITTKNTITDDEFDVLRDHKLNNRIIIAGAYQLYKINQLLQIQSRNTGVSFILKNVKFVNPWYTEDGKDFEVCWKSNMTIELVVKSKTMCAAKISIKESEPKIGSVLNNEEQDFDVNEFYETLYRNGLQYEDGFRKINDAKRTTKHCLSNLKNSSHIWPLIDAAMHSITASVIVERPNAYFLPVAMSTVLINEVSENNFSKLKSQAVITSENEKFIQVNVLLFSEEDVVCEIRNMTIVVMNQPTTQVNDGQNHDGKLDSTIDNNIINQDDNAKTNGNGTKSEIQIVGFDVTFPLNSDQNESWQFLKSSAVSQMLQFRKTEKLVEPRVNLLDIDVRSWDPEFFGIRPSETHYIDPQQRLLLSSVSKLLLSANKSSLPSNTGVFIGCSTHEFSHIVYAHANSNPKAEWGSGTANSAIAGRIAHWLKLKGPVITVDTACSSSMTALTLACDALKVGKCDYAIVGTINLVMHEMTTKVLESANMVVNDFCKVFDVDANGYKRSEAVCTMLLSKKSNTISDKNFAIISGWSTGHNGNSSSLITPNGTSQVEMMKNSCNFDRINSVESHCTGTKLGDAIEIGSITRMGFSQKSMSPFYISSIKSNVGHCEGASGLMSLCAILLQNKYSYNLPQMHLKCPSTIHQDSQLCHRFIGEENEMNHNNVLINNFGFTGSNCSIVMKLEHDKTEETADVDVYFPMMFSAHSQLSLEKYTDEFKKFVKLSSTPLNTISSSLHKRKIHHHREIVIYNYKRNIVWSRTAYSIILDPKLEMIVEQSKKFLNNPSIIEKLSSNNCGKFISSRLPYHVLNMKYFWKIDSFSNEVHTKSITNGTPLRKLFYEKRYVPKKLKEHSARFNKIASLGSFNDYTVVNCKNLQSEYHDVILFKPSSTCVSEFMRLLKLWESCDSNSFVIVCCPADNSTHTEWIGTIRSLAAEKELNYKFVSFENREQLEENFNREDVFESIFYRSNVRFVERLCQVSPIPGKSTSFQSVIISGGTGGIGTEVLNKIKPSKSVSISRSAKPESSTLSRKLVKADVKNYQSAEKFDGVFHFAGIVHNVTHWNMTEKIVEETVSVKMNGAENLAKFCDKSSTFVFSSSIASVLGSYGQSNYSFANGLVTSFLEKSNLEFDIIHWGPWKDVGMLADEDRSGIVSQLNSSGWRTLSSCDALSIFNTVKTEPKRQIAVFDGDFNMITSRQKHLIPFLSKLVPLVPKHSDEKKTSILKDDTYENIFKEITGFSDVEDKKNVPFMDIGLDSLCLENLRQTINLKLDLSLTVTDIFENSTFEKLRTIVEQNRVSNTVQFSATNSFSNETDDGRIAVIGWSAEFSDAGNIEEFWQNLMDGKCSTFNGIGKLKNSRGFDNQFFNITDQDAKVLDPQVKKFIQHAYLALENSGYINQRKTLKCSVFAGAEPSDYGSDQKQEDTMRKMFAMNMNNYLASYAAYCLDLNGEAVSVYTACSTTLVAICQAIHSLQQGRSDLALVGAASIAEEKNSIDGISDQKKTIFSKTGICRPFDEESEGIVRGSGVGCFVLKKLSKALQDNDDLKFVIEDFGLSNDGNSRASFMAPNPSGQLKCMEEVIEKLKDSKRQKIQFVECHATGTALGDTIEMNAIKKAYSFKSSIKIGSCKANIGHAFAASGLASLIKSALMLRTCKVPPQINFKNVKPEQLHFFNINKTAETLPSDCMIAVDSFGIGGTNCHMVIGIQSPNTKLAEKNTYNQDKISSLIAISAKSEKSLNKQKMSIYRLINNQKTNKTLKSIQKIFFQHREHHEYRSYIIADPVSTSNNFLLGDNYTAKTAPKLCFFFPPQGIQFSNILHDDFIRNSTFKSEIEKLCTIATKLTGENFLEILFPKSSKTDPENLIDDILHTQIGMLIQCLSIVKTLQHYNIKPTILAGHSLGEYHAATVSKVLDEKTMMELLYERSKLIEKTEDAEMIMIWSEVPYYYSCEVCSIIDDNIRCVVGSRQNIEMLKNDLERRKIKYRDVKTNYGFHSSMMSKITNSFENVCETFDFQNGTIPFISSINGKIFNTLNPSYCKNHLTSPVNLKLLVDKLISEKVDIVVEIGPSGVLSNLLAKRESKILVVPTCGTLKKPIETLLHSIGKLWSNGVPIILPNSSVSKTISNLPGYQFDDDDKIFERTNYDVVAHYPENNNKNVAMNKFQIYSECWIETRKHMSPPEQPIDFFILDDASKAKSIPRTKPVLIFFTESSGNIHDSYFNFETMLQNLPNSSFETLVVITNNPSPSNYLALGLLRCQQLKSKNRFVFVENFEKLDVADVLKHVFTTKSTYLKVSSNMCFELGYKDIECLSSTRTTKSIGSEKKVCIVFGASGYIGSVYVETLKNLNYEVVKVSQRESENCCDIVTLTDVETFFQKYASRKIEFLINCTGSETVSRIDKDFSHKLAVLSIKTNGNLNILKAISKYKLKVTKFIACSSMSSVIPLFGNEDYASANCFVEALIKQNHENVNEFLSIAFPPIEGSRMYNQTSESVKQMLKTQMMTETQLRDYIKVTLDLSSAIFIATKNPEVLKFDSEAHHRNDKDENANSENSINSNVDIAEILSNIWKQIIGSNIHIDQSTNFFSIGGDSLSALQLVWQIEKELGSTIHVDDVFNFPTLAEMKNLVINSGKPEKSNKPSSKSSLVKAPLTSSQTQMFVLRQVDLSNRYNVVFEIEIEILNEFDWTFFKYSILSLIAYQKSYRTKFSHLINSIQTVSSLTESFFNVSLKCGNIDIEEELDYTFDIHKTVPLRISAKMDATQKHINIIFNQHHILTDGWSMTVLAKYVTQLYNAYYNKSPFPEKIQQSMSENAILETLQSAEHIQLIDRILIHYDGFSHSSIPYDSSSNQKSNINDVHKRYKHAIPKNLWVKLLNLSKANIVTPYNVALTLFSQTVQSFTSSNELLFAYADSGRNSSNSELIGYCMNNLLFKCKLESSQSFVSKLQAVSHELKESRKFSSVPFFKIVEKRRELGSISIYFNFRQKLDFPSVTIPGANCQIEHISLNNAFDFSFTIDETPTETLITVDYDSSKYFESTVQEFVRIFLKFLKFSNCAETNYEGVQKRTDFPQKLFNERFLKELKTVYKNTTAIQNTNQSITNYGTLAENISELAFGIELNHQTSTGTLLREDDIIGIDSDCEESLLISCSCLGIPYTPIDRSWPIERQNYIIGMTKMQFYSPINNMTKSRTRIFCRSSQYGASYTLFTSGSTGMPKGVVMAEQSVSSFIVSATKRCGLRHELKILNSVRKAFDVSVSNIFGAFLNGCALIGEPSSSLDHLKNCHYAFLPSAVFNSLTFKFFKNMKNNELLTVGGETITDSVLNDFMATNTSGKIIQIYGPTETCIWSLTNQCCRFKHSQGAILGEFSHNQYCNIENNNIRGELIISGVSLARGYLSMSNQIGKSFGKFYKTGDIVDSRNGDIRFICRQDNQTKWKGIRIDLSEIEKEIAKTLCLQQIKLIIYKKMLIAFFVPLQKDKDGIAKLLQNEGHLHIPDHFVELKKMPLNSSGKLDKESLLQAFDQIRQSYEKKEITMTNSIEDKVLAVVSEVIAGEVSLDDKFNSVGGNSLSAIQVTHLLSETLGIEIKAHDILQNKSLKEFASGIAARVKTPYSVGTGVITKLREVPDSKFSIYLIHAIGGTIYPYYAFLQVFPKNVSIYGIEFDLKYPCNNLKQLAHFYANEIAAHAGVHKQIFVMGHSMGGIMSREIVIELKVWGFHIPFVMMFDSWVLRTNQLDIENIKSFLNYVFSGLPDSERRIDRAIKLAELLREYKTSISDTKLYLFKSKQLGEAAFKKAVRSDLSEELARSMTCNGFDELSLQPIDTYLIDGDHESCLKVENLKKVANLILAPFQPFL